jgi:hypothetical protein
MPHLATNHDANEKKNADTLRTSERELIHLENPQVTTTLPAMLPCHSLLDLDVDLDDDDNQHTESTGCHEQVGECIFYKAGCR